MCFEGNGWLPTARVGQNHYVLYTVFLAGKSPNIQSCMVQIYSHIQCKYTVIYGANIQSYTVQIYSHIRGKYTVLADPTNDPSLHHIQSLLLVVIQSTNFNNQSVPMTPTTDMACAVIPHTKLQSSAQTHRTVAPLLSCLKY
jgi:hypothetical protein